LQNEQTKLSKPDNELGHCRDYRGITFQLRKNLLEILILLTIVVPFTTILILFLYRCHQGLIQLYRSIANSKSRIWIHKLNSRDVAEMVRFLGLQTVCEKLFSKVLSVSCFTATDEDVCQCFQILQDLVFGIASFLRFFLS